MLGLITGIISAAVSVTKAVAVVGLAVQGLKVIANAVVSIGKALGLIKPETDPEELGDKALQAEEQGIVPENYDTYEAYLKEIEEFEIDPERSGKYTAEQKAMKGLEVSSGVVLEKCGDVPLENVVTYMAENTGYFEGQRAELFADAVKQDEGFLGDFAKYVSSERMDVSEKIAIQDKLVELEKAASPDISDVDALRKVMGMGGRN